MIISVINHTHGLLSDGTVQRAIRAINRQIEQDFEPRWNMGATLRLEGRTSSPGPEPLNDAMQHVVDMRGDAVIYLWHPKDVRTALGYHGANFLGIPYGYVFPELSESIGEPWTVTLSHEALELIADPEVNMLVMGPHPLSPRRTVFHWYEVCDAVQQERYEIDGVPVSNFVLPLYFTNSDEIGSRNDFLGLVRYGRPLRSFGVHPGGYIGYYNPESGEHEVFFAEGDVVSLRRLRFKNELGLARRSRRYQARTDLNQSSTSALRQFLGSM
ncbi:MAG TPA: hypothetical protein VJB57_02925 [Dehalococcoidia bacterium]|nr:hypothetical protein [Dehalococcoidia bacterium]